MVSMDNPRVVYTLRLFMVCDTIQIQRKRDKEKSYRMAAPAAATAPPSVEVLWSYYSFKN